MSLRRRISASQPRISSSIVITVSVLSKTLKLSRWPSRLPGSKSRSNSEKWSVSRTSNFFLVGLLLPILATQPNGLFKVWIVLEDANCPAPILLSRWAARLGAQLSDLLLELFHTFFKCLRHAGKIDHRFREFQHEMQPRQRPVTSATLKRASFRIMRR